MPPTPASFVARRRYISLAVAFLVLPGGCRRERKAVADADKWVRGDSVVVEARAGEFYEGRVVGVDGDELRVQRVRDGASTKLSAHEVYRLPSAGRVVNDQLVICGTVDAKWIPCRVVQTDEREVRVVNAQGQDFVVPRDRIVVPGELTSLNLKRHFAGARQRAHFAAAAAQAGDPAVDPDWSPEPKEQVLVQRADGWFSARVHELDKERVYVKWEASGRITEVVLAKVVPEGPYSTDPGVGGFVLSRPQSPAEAWVPLRVSALVEEHSVVLEDARGERQTRPLRDVVPLTAARVP